MSLVEAFRTRLLAINPAVFATVEGAAELAALRVNPPLALPAAYVMIREEASAENTRATGAILQRCEADVAVLIVTGNLSDHRGDAAAADLESLKAAVRGALVGLVPDAATGDPVQHVSGQIVDFRHGLVWHEELFSAAYTIEEQS